jgi:hypothetical protein
MLASRLRLTPLDRSHVITKCGNRAVLAHDPEKPAPHLMRGVQRFSEKIMRKQEANPP